ncbi:unnamed protein product, partial [Prorocentrum cordatum]
RMSAACPSFSPPGPAGDREGAATTHFDRPSALEGRRTRKRKNIGRGRAGRAGRDGGARHAAARPLSSLEALRSLPSSTSALPDVAVGPEEAVCTDEHRVLPGVGGGGSRMRLLSPAPKSAIVFVL